MKRLIAELVAVAALLTGAVAVTEPAVATTSSVQNQANACYQNSNLPTEVNGCKFWTGTTICVDGSGINGAYYDVDGIAQKWNIAVGTPTAFALDYSNDCVADLYTPSLRMVIDGYHGGTSGACMLITNAARVTYQNFQRWTNGPGAYINLDRSDCVGSQFRRNHSVSAAIGYLIGLEVLSSSGWSGRVMYNDSDAQQYPTNGDATTVREIYLGYWGN